MDLLEFTDFLRVLPKKFNSFELVKSEYGIFENRIDKPIKAVIIDIENNKICFLHQTKEEINAIEE